jgi:hypothetical protein
LFHFSAKVQVGIDGQLLVGGCIDPAFVGSYRDINGAFAFVVLADAFYHSHFFFSDIFGVQPDSDCGG